MPTTSEVALDMKVMMRRKTNVASTKPLGLIPVLVYINYSSLEESRLSRCNVLTNC